MDVRTNARIDIAADREAVFDMATDPDRFHEYFTGYGPVPAIDSVQNVDGEATGPGTVRRVHNCDGSVIEEHMDEFVRPERQRYRLVKGFAAPFSLMIASGEGFWTFEERGDATRITWRVAFTLRSPLAWPVAAPIVGIFMRGAMARCLANIRAAVESQRAAA